MLNYNELIKYKKNIVFQIIEAMIWFELYII